MSIDRNTSSWVSRLGLPSGRRVALDAPGNPEVRFEHSDISGLRVVLAGGGLILALWIIVVLLHFVFQFLAHYRASVSAPAFPLSHQLNTLPPEPRLQAEPRVDLKRLRATEDWYLHNYNWVDRQKGIVSIPIDRAMQIIAERGIPPQKAPANLKLSIPSAGTRRTGLEGKAGPDVQ